MTPSTEALRKLPLVIVLGATATGKSKLAVSIARQFKGEIISADSMQIYKGLDILTNKMNETEMQGVPHHMMSILDGRQHFDITLFQKQALPIVERILKDGKIPVIVGGTNYYIESILWEVLVTKGKHEDGVPAEASDRKTTTSLPTHFIPYNHDSTIPNPNEILDLFQQHQENVNDTDLEPYLSTTLHSALELCDPVRASTLHPNDRRKIIRSLQVCYQTGRKHSEIIAEQRQLSTQESKGDEDADTNTNHQHHLGGPLRFENSLCFWIQADQQLLQQRIDRRVDEMVQNGLRNELNNYIDDLRADDMRLDFTKGLLQSIGFKEFNSYLQLPPAERESLAGDALFVQGIDLLKIATRQYARRQLKWITHRFLQPKKRQVPPIYRLNGNLTDHDSWEINVTQPALAILENHLKGDFEQPLLLERLVPASNDDSQEDGIVRYCQVCDNRAFVGNVQWEAHLRGAKHRKMKKRKQIQAWATSSDFAATTSPPSKKTNFGTSTVADDKTESATVLPIPETNS